MRMGIYTKARSKFLGFIRMRSDLLEFNEKYKSKSIKAYVYSKENNFSFFFCKRFKFL